MRGEFKTQMYCISESNGAMFELKMNEALQNLRNPDIRMDHSKPFTAYIFYSIEYDIPESVTEAMEIITGERHTCIECPALEISKDKRKKRHQCTRRGWKVHGDTPVCMEYYKILGEKGMLKDPDDQRQLNE